MVSLKSQYSYPTSWLISVAGCLWLSITAQVPLLLAQQNTIPDGQTICDINFNLLKSNPDGDRLGIVTADTVSPEKMTLPSFWWMSEQLPAKLVTNWIAYRKQQQVYVLVNTQYWSMLDYIDRYRTIDQFGRVAQSYGYNLKLCSSQKIVMASYSCNPIDPTQAKLSTPTSCQLWLNPSGQNGLGIQGK